MFVADNQSGLRLLSQLRQDAATRRRSRLQRTRRATCDSARITPISTRRTNPTEIDQRRCKQHQRRPRARLRGQHRRSSRAIGSRSFRAISSRPTPTGTSRPTRPINVDLLAASGFYARGNENNQHQPDGVLLPRPRQARRATRSSTSVATGGRRRACASLPRSTTSSTRSTTPRRSLAPRASPTRQLHRPPVCGPGDRRRAAARARNVLRAGRAPHGVDRCQLHFRHDAR